MRADRLVVAAGGICLAAALCCLGAFGQSKNTGQTKIKVVKDKTAPAPVTTEPSSEPDKVLYDRSMNDLSHKRYEEERLSLETLINTYPDSEYLDKAKLAVADSYYNEGGDSNLTQAIGEYKSFVVFFPDDDKASYAQMQIGMAHYKMMAKSDRDSSEALNAEAELQTFITTYRDRDSKLIPSAEQKLRDVQEVIADGEYKVARFYYLRPDYVAAAARLTELTERYPLYSQSDEALWMLSNIYSKARALTKNEDVKNHYADLEGKVLDQIVVNYPLSARASQAKAELKTMNMAVPAADPAAVARMQKQEAYEKAHRKSSLMAGPMAMLKTGADFSLAAQSGMPNLTPPDNSITARDILLPTSTGPRFSLSASTSTAADTSGSVVPPATTDAPADGSTSPEPSPVVGAPTTSASDSGSTSSGSTSNDPVGVASPPVTSASPASTDSSSSSSNPSDAGQTNGTTDNSASSPQSGTAAEGSNQQPAPAASSESSSKKKKGIGKLNPF